MQNPYTQNQEYTKHWDLFWGHINYLLPHRPGVDRLVEFLYDRTCYFVAPASCKHHMSVEGGLLMHSVGVAEYSMTLKRVLCNELPDSSVRLCALFHDLGKCGTITTEKDIPRYTKRVIKTGERAGSIAYNHNPEEMSLPIAVNSAQILGKFVDLSPAEIQAVVAHDGQYIPENRSFAHNEHPLTLILHYADYWQGHVVEGNLNPLDYLDCSLTHQGR